jgi:hypothetical protein
MPSNKFAVPFPRGTAKPNDPMATLCERFRQWWLTRDLLIVNFGSSPGRVPLVMLSRSQVIHVVQADLQVSFESNSPDQQGWQFVVHLKTPESAAELTLQLKRRQRHILEPLGDIACVIHTRLDSAGATRLPYYIGGDIALAAVPEDQYWRNSNGAWVFRSDRSVGRAEERTEQTGE